MRRYKVLGACEMHGRGTGIPVTKLIMLHETGRSMINGIRRQVHVHCPTDVTLNPQKTVSYFAKRCEQILDLAVKWAPTETKAILEVKSGIPQE